MRHTTIATTTTLRRAAAAAAAVLIATLAACSSGPASPTPAAGSGNSPRPGSTSPAPARTRPATLIGAATTPTLAGWDSARSQLGPFQTQRIFYRQELPASYAGSYCAELPLRVTCVVSYKTPTVNVTSYVRSVPPRRHLILIFHHEPENEKFPGPGTSGHNFVLQFEAQSRLIRAAVRGGPRRRAPVQVAMAAEAFQYQPGTRWDKGAACAFIPPAAYVDDYLVDIYEPRPDGANLFFSLVQDQWRTWLHCVDAANRADPARPAALGIAEYGLGTLAGNAVRRRTLTADAAYLARNFPQFALWEYWWQDDESAGPCSAESCDWQFTDPATMRAWHVIQARA